MDPGESRRRSELISFILESLPEIDHGDSVEMDVLVSELLNRLNESEMDLQNRKEIQALLSVFLDRLDIFGREPGNSERWSLILSKFLDRHVVGTQEEVEIWRRPSLVEECIKNYSNSDVKVYHGGSRSEGLTMKGSDTDMMYIDKGVVVMYPGQPIPPDCTLKTVLYMRQADNCRPGYVTLQLSTDRQQNVTPLVLNAFVPDGYGIYISSDIYRESFLKEAFGNTGYQYESNGPSGTITSTTDSSDVVPGFHCVNWPRQANEWITRPRPYGWPTPRLIDTIARGGCHAVPVGDKCSDDTHLQWRVSLIKAERLLVHSFSHIQFKVYGLLKYMLKQIKPTLQRSIGDDDILCSYFLKIVMFTAIENSHKMLWQEKNLFCCFWFCFNILIAWVQAGYCPNYFIPANNMFQRKIYGIDNSADRQKLLHILHDVHRMKWKCLSIGTSVSRIWQALCDIREQSHLIYPPPELLEVNRDKNIANCMGLYNRYVRTVKDIHKVVYLLTKSQSVVDEALTYYCLLSGLSSLAIKDYTEHGVASGNKARYRRLRKCKHWLTQSASLGTHLLYLATFHFQTGNYRKPLEMCGHVTSSVWYYTKNGQWAQRQDAMYMQKCCGQGHSFNYKMKHMFAFDIVMDIGSVEFCLPHLHTELTRRHTLYIPPLPYAAFLSFLCHHELGDARRRDAALRHLISWTCDEDQGGHTHWIVHTLLGICYQTVGDYRRAVRSYWDSRQVDGEGNPALERIAVVYLTMCYQTLSAAVL